MGDAVNSQQPPAGKGFPWRGVLIGCGIFAILGVLAACAVGVILYRLVQPPENVTVMVAAPGEAVVGQESDLVVTVSNQRADEVHVGDIDLAESYANAFTVVSTDPEPKSRTGYGVFGIQSFTFGTSIPAGSSQVFTFRLRATTAGIHRGDVDVSVGNGMITKVAESVVRESSP